MKTIKRWLGSTPEVCDTCNKPIVGKFYDAKTKKGPWANMCHKCFTAGPGFGKLGVGLGQEYTVQADGWVKTGG